MKLSKGKRFLLAALGLIVVAGAATALLWTRRAAAEDFITAKIERGNIRHSVTATGTLQAVTTVQVGSQVSGIISELYADFNAQVRKGQVVAQLDPSILQAQLDRERASNQSVRANLSDAEARVLAAKANLENLRAGVSSSTANLAAVKAQRDDAESFLKRQEALARDGIVNQRDLESARTNYQAAEARYKQAEAQLNQARTSEQSAATAGLAQAEAQLKQAKAQLQQSDAAVKQAEVNLSHTTIASPIDGVVVSRNVDKGQTVAASLSAPTLFTIANDLTSMQVIANIDQADIGAINDTNRVTFTVDAYPGQGFTGKIRQIRLSPQNVQNVVTYNVVIDVENPELKLKPGMTANLTIIIAERNGVLRLPNAALRFMPQGMTQEKIRELIRGGNAEGGAAKPPADGKASPASSPTASPEASASPATSPSASPSATGQPAEQRRQGGERSGPGSGERGQFTRGGEGRGEGRSGGEGSRRERGEWRGEGRGEGRSMSGMRRGSEGQGEGRRGGEGRAGGPSGAQQGGRAGGEGGFVRGAMGMSTSAVLQGQTRLVWVPGPNNTPQHRRIKLGITDGVNTEIVEGDLKEGDIIIVGQNRAPETRPQGTQRPPGFGGPGGMGGGGGGRGPR
jgi:HlyD family secretion protein